MNQTTVKGAELYIQTKKTNNQQINITKTENKARKEQTVRLVLRQRTLTCRYTWDGSEQTQIINQTN